MRQRFKVECNQRKGMWVNADTADDAVRLFAMMAGDAVKPDAKYWVTNIEQIPIEGELT